MKFSATILGHVCVATAIALSGCDRASKPERAEPIEKERIGYDADTWWESPDVNRLLLAASQIVISHRDANTAAAPVPFDAPDRSRADALERAHALRQQLKAHPERFAELARSGSDERTTAAMGGSLGMFYAMSMPREVTDALGHLRVGEVSRVVETEHGFYLLRRDAVSADATLSLAHIVIKSADASGWRRLDREPTVRTRAEARKLAEQVARDLGKTPSEFGALVTRYSDAEDAARGGDLGQWSRHENTLSEFLLLTVGGQLPIGGISGVVETPTGFHVLMRTADRPRPALAARAITVLHTESQFEKVSPNASRSRQRASEIARDLIAQLQRQPERFDRLQTEYCEIAFCGEVLGFHAGRGSVPIELALAQLSPGQIAPAPVETPFGMVVVRAEDPTRVKPPAQVPPVLDFPMTLGLGPTPELLAQAEAEQAAEPSAQERAEYIRGLARYAREQMQLSGSEGAGFERILGELADKAANESSDEEFDRSAKHTEQQIAQLLGAQRLEEFARHRRAWSAAEAH